MRKVSPREREAFRAAAVVGVILLGIAARLPLAFHARDIPAGHADSALYFRKAYEEYAVGFLEPLPHSGSGWPLLLAGAMRLWGVPVASVEPTAVATAIVFSYVFHAMIAAGLVTATLLLARLVATPRAALFAGVLVALDPFLLRHATDVMADALYAILIVLAIACVVKAREGRGWLAVAGSLVALSHMVRMNGLVMLPMIVLFARVYLRRARPEFVGWRSLAIIVIVFFLVASPYLLWRGSHLPHAFDYGTNQRLFTDDRWDFADGYWSHYTIASGGPRESAGDYAATHTWGDAARRAWESVWLQVRDVALLGGPEEGAALSPLLLILAIAGSLRVRRSVIVWVLPLLFVFTFATFVWIYPTVRSVRYYMPLVPVAAVMAGILGDHALARASLPLRWGAVAAGAAITLLLVPADLTPALGIIARSPPLGGVAISMTVTWVGIGVVGWSRITWPGRPRPGRRRRSRNPSDPRSSGTRLPSQPRWHLPMAEGERAGRTGGASTRRPARPQRRP